MTDSQFSAKPRKYGLVGQVMAALAGAIIWGGLFAILGGFTNQQEIGAVAGAAVGAIIGFSRARGWIGPVVLWMSAFAFVGAFLGPACDADPLRGALWGAAVGALLGATGLRGLFALIGGCIGWSVSVTGGPAGALFGLVVGAGLGWGIGLCVRWIWHRFELDL